MWNKHKWKKGLAFIMAVCLMSGSASGGTVYAKASEDTAKEMLETAQEQPEQGLEEQITREQPEQGLEEQITQEQPEQAEETEKKEGPEEITEETASEEEAVPEEKPVTEEPAEPQAEETAETETVKLETQMQIKQLSRLAASGAVAENESVSVKIYNNDVETEGTIHTGYIADNVPQNIEGSHFVGAYVVTASGEDEISYIGSFVDGEGKTVIYYALSDTPETGMILRPEEGQYIKLVYKTTCNIKYEVRLEDGTEVNGGTFLDKRESTDYGTDVRFQFKAAKGESDVDYTLVSVKATGDDGKKTEIKVDSDGYGYLNNVRQNMTVTATVKGTSQYRLVVDSQEGGHVCWAGHSDEKNSNTKNPYSVDASKFCSYRASDGATVTTAPGGTIYFVLYSQAWTGGGVWEFESLLVNDKPLDAILYDGEEYVMDIGNGMTAHFRYLGGKADGHLSGSGGLFGEAPSEKIRCKYECWIENVHEDIHVKFKNFDSNNHEIVKLAQADGIESVCASTFDRRYTGAAFGLFGGGYYDFWIDLYRPVNAVGQNISDVTYVGNGDAGGAFARPNAPWAQTFRGPGVISSTGDDGYNWHFSTRAHVEVKSRVYITPDAKKETEEWGSRYIYFKTKTGYDPRTLNARITGKGKNPGEATIPLTDIDNIANLATTNVTTLFSNKTSNSSLQQAKKAGYQWYVRYDGAGYNMRNLYLQCDPYQFGVEYDLNGGEWKAGKEHADDKKYTIESGSNRISLPGDSPVQEGKNFVGWKLEPINGGYTQSTDKLYNTDDIFRVAGSNFEAALETEKIEYELPIVTGGVNEGEDLKITYVKYTDYSPISGGNHRFRFVAQWVDENDPSSPKAEYSVKVYTETAPGTEGAVEVDGKTYTLEEKTYAGTKGEDVISIHRTPEGYILNRDKSVVILRNFMQDGNTDKEIVYYFDKPEWAITQASEPAGGPSADEAAKVKINNEVSYTLKVENKEEETVILPAGTVITAVLPEGMQTPVNRSGSGLKYNYQEDARTITYTLDEPREMKAGESLELKYSVTVAESGLMESQAVLNVDWKRYETEKLYHITCADLTISNTLRGDYADYTKEFEVTVKLTDRDGNPLADKNIEYQGGTLGVQGANGAPAGGNATLNGQNEIKFKLKHGQTITLKDLPYGCTYKVTQKDESGYVTTYAGVNMTGGHWKGTNLPVATGLWPSVDWFSDPYEQITLYPGMVFEYDGEYFAITRTFSLNQAQAELGPEGKGPDGETNGWFGVTKLTGNILEMEDGAENIFPITRGDVVKYKGEYYLFNTGGEVGCNPENDTGTPPHYHNLSNAGVSGGLIGDQTVEITNTYEKVSPTGINGGDSNFLAMCFAIALMSCAVAGCGVRYRKTKKSM